MMIDRMPDVKPIPGMHEALEQLHQDGWTLMVISSNSRQNVVDYLIKHQMDQYFDRVYGGVGIFGKTMALRKVIKQNKLDRKTCFYIGDEARDIQAARKTRIGSVAVSWGYNDVSLLKAEKPTAVAENPAGLVTIFADM
jgi:phosphoglycolate phosphatase